LLTGKYNNGIPVYSRLARTPQWRSEDMPQRIAKVKELVPIAKALGCSLAQLALAWCLKNPHVSSVIIGANNIEQLKENLSALELLKQLDETTIKEIEAITYLEETN
jgi:aryl-alcohol dehydrogenase-like predicted oxidoreductase